MDATEERMHDLVNKHLHPNLWGNIRTAYLDGNKDPVGANGDYKIRYLTGLFADHQFRIIKDAIDNKESIMITKPAYTPQDRARIICVTKGDDGVLKGWYSSMDPVGMCHGRRYLLIDYDKATFVGDI